jgi:hypothetical protein
LHFNHDQKRLLTLHNICIIVDPFLNQSQFSISGASDLTSFWPLAMQCRLHSSFLSLNRSFLSGSLCPLSSSIVHQQFACSVVLSNRVDTCLRTPIDLHLFPCSTLHSSSVALLVNRYFLSDKRAPISHSFNSSAHSGRMSNVPSFVRSLPESTAVATLFSSSLPIRSFNHRFLTGQVLSNSRGCLHHDVTPFTLSFTNEQFEVIAFQSSSFFSQKVNRVLGCSLHLRVSALSSLHSTYWAHKLSPVAPSLTGTLLAQPEQATFSHMPPDWA